MKINVEKDILADKTLSAKKCEEIELTLRLTRLHIIERRSNIYVATGFLLLAIGIFFSFIVDSKYGTLFVAISLFPMLIAKEINGQASKEKPNPYWPFPNSGELDEKSLMRTIDYVKTNYGSDD
jgi:hypothetical protein